MSLIGVMQVVDTLDVGGAERVAVSLANCLPRDRYHSHLCTTRREGPLSALIAQDVGRLALNRRRTLDLAALWRLARYIRKHGIQVLHAHGHASAIAVAAARLSLHPRVIAHFHFGRLASENRRPMALRLAARLIDGAIVVNEQLEAWARERLGISPERVWYIPNFVVLNNGGAATSLPGLAGKRLVCVANIRPEKDHATLLRAMAVVLKSVPDAHLLLAGAVSDASLARTLKELAAELNVAPHVTWLGPREDVAAVLRACDIGVLSSSSEGLPLALIEYGMAGLAAVATNVGQCGEVIEYGKGGRLVASGDPEALAEAIGGLLHNTKARRELAARFSARTRATYSVEAVLPRICNVYETVMEV